MKAVIFDLDGVLVDSFEAHRKAFNMVMEKHFGFNVGREEFLVGFGGDPREITRMILLNHGVKDMSDIEKLYAKKREIYNRQTSKKIKSFPEARELLSRLKEGGIRLAVASSSSRKSVEKLMEKTGFERYFEVLVGLDDVEKGKPNPDLFLKAAEKLNVRPEDCTVIEDSIYGIQAGKAAGMKVVGVQTGFRTREELEKAGADLVVENLEELELEDLG